MTNNTVCRLTKRFVCAYQYFVLVLYVLCKYVFFTLSWWKINNNYEKIVLTFKRLKRLRQDLSFKTFRKQRV